jgi:hypothetical protein
MMAGIELVMQHLGMLARQTVPTPQNDPCFVTMWVPSAPCSGLWYAMK